MADSDADKSQEATPHRRQQAREEGQIAQSQDLASAAVLLLSLLALWMFAEGIFTYFGTLCREQLGGEAWLTADAAFAVRQWYRVIYDLGRVVLPLLGLIMLAAVAAHVMQVGFLFLPGKVTLDPTHLDPVKGLGRVFSIQSVVRLAFGIFKVIVVAAVAYASLSKERAMVLRLSDLAVGEIAVFIVQSLFWTTVKIAAALLALALLDYLFQRWKYEKDISMTTQEIREEMKSLEGDPQMISRRRAVQRQLAASRLSAAVPKADVVVTNPTELAIAIQYDPETMAAPIVVAKGAGPIAKRIRELALENGIPIVEKKPLAQALYREVDVNHPIPHDKYAAVAEILAYVYQLKGKEIPVPGARRSA